MDDDLKLLIRVQEHVIQCRKLAAEIPDLETSQMLRTFADEIEQRAREIDAMR